MTFSSPEDRLLSAADDAMRAGDHRRAAELLEQHLTMRQRPGPDDFLRLAVAKRALGDGVGALVAVGGAIRVAPHHFMALLMSGSLLESMGRVEESARTYAAALAHAPPAAMLPPVLLRELDRARHHVAAHQSWREGLVARAETSLHAATIDERRRIEGFRDGLIEDGPLMMFPGLPAGGFVDPARFDGVAALEAAFDTILAEFRVLVRERAPELVSMIDHVPGSPLIFAPEDGTRKWSVINLLRNGEVVEENARFCPETIRRYLDIDPPRIAGRSPNLMFSLLDAHTRIPAHRGVTNTRLTIHLPLIVPRDCAIRVGSDTRAWQPGRAMVFDDTLDHEAWNDSDDLRVVLLGDLWQPEMSAVERASVAALLGVEADIA